MAIPFPDILEHNNPNNPLMDVNQLEGVSIINLLTERDTIPLAKRKGGHFVISKTEEKAYIYTGTTLNDIDWDNASNWTECGGSIDGTFISPTGVNINTVTPYIVTSAGDIGWNAVDGTFDMKLLSGVTLQAGQELYFYGKATEAISNGDCVQFAGVQGDHITLKKAVQSEIAVNPMLIIGVATQNISNNAFGYVTGFGKVNGVYTTGFSLGSLLYYDSASTVAGKVTSVVPVAPYRKVLLATVIKLQTGSDENGIILVRPTFGLKLTDLDDVDGNDTNIADTDIIIKGDTTGIFKRITWANVKTLLSTLPASQITISTPIGYNATNQQTFDEEIALNTLKGNTISYTTPLDADSLGIWDSTNGLFKRISLFTLNNFFTTKYLSDVWDLSLDNGNILVKGHITQAGTFAIKVRYKFYQNVSDVSVKLFPSTIVGGNWVRFEIADYCRNSNRVGTSVLAFTITNFYSVGNNFIGTNFSNIAGSGSVTENQQDDNNTYLESIPRALYSNIDFIVDHTNASVYEEAWGIVHLTGTIL